jgi:hypothetical protein
MALSDSDFAVYRYAFRKRNFAESASVYRWAR